MQLLEEKAPGLVRSLHVGESFFNELNGVRRVGECLRSPGLIQRFGHCLGLARNSHMRRSRRPSRPSPRTIDAISDLCWLVLNELPGSDEAASLLHDLARPQPGLAAIAVDDWLDAYRALFTKSGLLGAAVLTESSGTLRPLKIDELQDLAYCGDGRDRAMAAFVWHAPPAVTGCDVLMRLPLELNQAVSSFAVTYSPDALDFVLDAICSGNDESGPVIESCPSSNRILARLDGPETHPLWEWTLRGARVSVSSDDPLLFGCTVLDEFEDLKSVGDRVTVERIARTSVASCGGGRRWTADDYLKVVQIINPQLIREG